MDSRNALIRPFWRNWVSLWLIMEYDVSTESPTSHGDPYSFASLIALVRRIFCSVDSGRRSVFACACLSRCTHSTTQLARNFVPISLRCGRGLAFGFAEKPQTRPRSVLVVQFPLHYAQKTYFTQVRSHISRATHTCFWVLLPVCTLSQHNSRAVP